MLPLSDPKHLFLFKHVHPKVEMQIQKRLRAVQCVITLWTCVRLLQSCYFQRLSQRVSLQAHECCCFPQQVGREAASHVPHHSRLQAKATASADALAQMFMQGLYQSANKCNVQGMQRLSKGLLPSLLKGTAFPVKGLLPSLLKGTAFPTVHAEGVWDAGGTAAACEGHP